MRTPSVVVMTPDELRALVVEAVADGLAKAGERPEANEIMSCEQAAEFLGVHPDTVPRLVRDQGLPTLRRVGKLWRFRRSDLLAWLNRKKSA